MRMLQPWAREGHEYIYRQSRYSPLHKSARTNWIGFTTARKVRLGRDRWLRSINIIDTQTKTKKLSCDSVKIQLLFLQFQWLEISLALFCSLIHLLLCPCQVCDLSIVGTSDSYYALIILCYVLCNNSPHACTLTRQYSTPSTVKCNHANNVRSNYTGSNAMIHYE